MSRAIRVMNGEKVKYTSHDFVCISLIYGFCWIRKPEFALQLFGNFASVGALRPNVVTWYTALVMAGMFRRVIVVSHLLCKGKNDEGLARNFAFYSNWIGGYFRKGLLMEAFQKHGETMAKGIKPDARRLYKGMQEMDLVRNPVSYCRMINDYCKAGKIDQALKIFDDFRKTSTVSVPCYNCMIIGLCNNNMVDLAAEVFMELGEKRLGYDVNTYLALFKAILDEKGAEGILNLIYRIENTEMELDDRLCNDAIHLLCKRNFHIAAAEVYFIIRRNHLVMTSKSYYSILKRLIVGGEFWLVKSFMNNFIKDYGLFDSKVSKILVYYLSIKSIEKALNFLNKMKENNLSINFPVSALKALTQNGRSLDAYELIRGAQDNLQSMDVIGFSIIVDGLCKEGHPVKALDICAFAEKKGITLNIVTYNSVINGLCLQGCLIEAFRVFDSLESINLMPSDITYGTLIDCLCREGYISDAKLLVERMILKGHKNNTHICNSLLSGLCKFGLVAEALKILNDMERNQLDLDEFTVSALIHGYGQKGDMEGALGFFFEHKEKGITPDFLGFLFLIRGLCTKGRMEEARSILREMLQSKSVIDLIISVDSEVETESVENFLHLLCEQGSIKEAVTILDEIGYLLFPVQKSHNLCHKLKELQKSYEAEDFVGGVQRPVPWPGWTDFDCESSDMVKTDTRVDNSGGLSSNELTLDRFHFHYLQIASLCSRGELQEANKLAKDFFASPDGHA